MTTENNSHTSKWRFYFPSAIVVVCGILLLFQQTVSSLWMTWSRSDTFAHGFVILPVVGWLIWSRREDLEALNPRPQPWGLLFLAGAGFLWLLGDLADALVVEQLALVFMLVFGVWTNLGNQVAKAMAFPLAFLFFAVPLGEDLIPPLMEYTATFTIALLKISGIPVYREGLYFYIPTGSWSVVEACSGIRYLIASITLGCLYAYLTYNSMMKRLIFIAFSILVPVVANGLRAYMIVMIGHLSEMKLATGIDHIIYGWVFFGLIILLMFSVGAIWRDHETTRTGEHQSGSDRSDVKSSAALTSAVLILVVTAAWPLLANAIAQRQSISPGVSLQPPEGKDGWSLLPDQIWDWTPRIVGADNSLYSFYTNGSDVVGVYLGQYLNQRQDSEAVNSRNILLTDKEKRWRIIDRSTDTIELNGVGTEIKSSRMTGAGIELWIWNWYRVGNRYTSNPYAAKLFEVQERLTFGRLDGTYLLIALKIAEGTANAEGVLQEFLDAMLPDIEQKLDAAAGEG